MAMKFNKKLALISISTMLVLNIIALKLKLNEEFNTLLNIGSVYFILEDIRQNKQ